jgi:hypothetical protein
MPAVPPLSAIKKDLKEMFFSLEKLLTPKAYRRRQKILTRLPAGGGSHKINLSQRRYIYGTRQYDARRTQRVE